MRASEVFRERLADDYTLTHNPYARFVYDTLRGYEDHHAHHHADCEEREREQIRLMVEAISRGDLRSGPPWDGPRVADARDDLGLPEL